MIKSQHATIRLPELDFEIPPMTQAGSLSTVEGVLMQAASGLESLQPQRREWDAPTAEKIQGIIDELKAFAAGARPFVLTLDDPAGQSLIEATAAGSRDFALTSRSYTRSAEQDAAIGVVCVQARGVRCCAQGGECRLRWCVWCAAVRPWRVRPCVVATARVRSVQIVCAPRQSRLDTETHVCVPAAHTRCTCAARALGVAAASTGDEDSTHRSDAANAAAYTSPPADGHLSKLGGGGSRWVPNKAVHFGAGKRAAEVWEGLDAAASGSEVEVFRLACPACRAEGEEERMFPTSIPHFGQACVCVCVCVCLFVCMLARLLCRACARALSVLSCAHAHVNDDDADDNTSNI